MAGCIKNTKYSIAEGLRPLFVPITSALVMSVPHETQQEVVDLVPVGQSIFPLLVVNLAKTLQLKVRLLLCMSQPK